MLDKGLPLTYEQSVTKLFISETRRQVFDLAMQLLGHYGELADVINGHHLTVQFHESISIVVAGLLSLALLKSSGRLSL